MSRSAAISSVVDPLTFRVPAARVVEMLAAASLPGSSLDARHLAWEVTTRLAGGERPAPLQAYRDAWAVEQSLVEMFEALAVDAAAVRARADGAWLAGDRDAWAELTLQRDVLVCEQGVLIADAASRQANAKRGTARGFADAVARLPRVPDRLDPFLARVVGQACRVALREKLPLPDALAPGSVRTLARGEASRVSFEAMTQTRPGETPRSFVSDETRLVVAAVTWPRG